MSDKQFESEKENLETQNLMYWSSFYAKEGQRLEGFLKQFGVVKTDLPEKCESSLNSLVKIAQELNLNKVNSSTYLMAINDLYKKKFENDIEKNELMNEINNINQNLLDLNLIHESLLRDAQMTESKLPQDKKQLNDMEAELEYMKTKSEKYKNQSEEYKQYNNSIDASLKHSALVKEYRELKSLESKIETMKKSLDTYQDLPPNLTMAKLKLHELKDEIRTIDNEIETKMNFMQ